ncbi:DUF481 domain-containing protein [Silvibacterium acidisoli]|uniref:DUF481 domain-containing protein n=1 Tax=Acidobacteriaceae bacterium ZG23-2 TaxID=2883246 RepID=UPI00406D3269
MAFSHTLLRALETCRRPHSIFHHHSEKLFIRQNLPAVFLFLGLIALGSAAAQAQTPDTITFTNGDKLTGKIAKAGDGSISFHSDVLGDITISLAKVASVQTDRSFAVGEKGIPLHRKTVAAQVPMGKVEIENKQLSVTIAQDRKQSFPVDELRFLIPAEDFQRELKEEYNFLHGWTGSGTIGISLVQATNSAQTYTGTVGLTRSIPTTTGLPPVSKTTLNLSGTYGLAKDPTIISGGQVYQTASITKTDILHGDMEYDRYFSRPIFGLVNASVDHNFGNGLELQEAYGGGIGWSILRSPANSLDVKATLQYEKQSFYNNVTSGLGTPDENLIGATVGENWSRTFVHNIKFTESATVMPAFNVVQASSAAASAGFVFPVYKKLSFSVTSTDNYLGDPPEGFLRNTFQFTTGLTYTFK